jgi:hypothetical protein
VAIRTLDFNFPDTIKTYAQARRAESEARKYADRLEGMVNVTIVPVACYEGKPRQHDFIGATDIRYTAVFSCFSKEFDISRMVHMRSPFVCYR